MVGKALEWGGSDVLMRWEMEEMRAVLAEYEAQERLKAGARWAALFSLPLWVLIGLGVWLWVR